MRTIDIHAAKTHPPPRPVDTAASSAGARANLPCRPLSAAAPGAGLAERPVRSAHAVRVTSLPPRHRNPFDRLLVAHAMSEPARLVAARPALPPWSELVTLAG